MNLKKFLLAGVVGGIVANVVDFVVHAQLLRGTYEALPSLFNPQAPVPWLVFGDFVAVFIFIWVYDRVYASFGGGPKGGAIYGLYAGILANFPTWIFMHLLVIGWPYSLSWIWTIYGIIWCVIIGAVAGALYKK
jgi:hypothetical protein